MNQLGGYLKYGVPASMGLAGLTSSLVNGDDIGTTAINTLAPAAMGLLGTGLAGKYMAKGNPVNLGATAMAAGLGLGVIGNAAGKTINSQLQQSNTPGFRNQQQIDQARVNDYMSQVMEEQLRQAELLNQQQQQMPQQEVYYHPSTDML